MQKKEYSNKRKYKAPEAEIIRFDSEDVITASKVETRFPLVSGSKGGGISGLSGLF